MLEARNLLDSLNHQTGKVALPNGVASLDVPDSFYYLSPEDSEKVLVDVWGNLPGTGSETLGMLLPSDTTPYDDNSWGVTIEYEEDGYVSDENADDLDYNELLEQMKKDAQEASKQRVAEGYEPIELIGWASPPYYDKTSNKLYWAKEIKFGSQELHTLNYNIRVLGRKGVLVLNFIAGMDQKSLIDSNLQTVLNMTEFNQGSRYEDFDPSIDKVAAYGIGALVAGKVIAKTGLIAAALIFLKKFGVLFIIGIGALFRKIFKKK
ncbi:DUF2167 domain-containing protein [Amphritea sp. ZJ14W]|uniref:DUF2167 domain-containing protein n=1 Tax=Amphritea pacifica TaxID=2811233 RepID=A0ABS2WBK9_9GAMM|nr:DUF2167 domain-containing protein [Amphritea pacifica]MBN1009166.1 DUF2167 domain-containing protein [Amphritea pacifica]